MKTVPANTPVMEPRVLKACEKFSLRAAVAGAPIWVMKGFDAVSRNESPDAITKSAIKKNQYLPTLAAGQKSPAPVANKSSPVMSPVLYPLRRILSAAGIARKK